VPDAEAEAVEPIAAAVAQAPAPPLYATSASSISDLPNAGAADGGIPVLVILGRCSSHVRDNGGSGKLPGLGASTSCRTDSWRSTRSCFHAHARQSQDSPLNKATLSHLHGHVHKSRENCVGLLPVIEIALHTCMS
jgi:hypothetical protein